MYIILNIHSKQIFSCVKLVYLSDLLKGKCTNAIDKVQPIPYDVFILDQISSKATVLLISPISKRISLPYLFNRGAHGKAAL